MYLFILFCYFYLFFYSSSAICRKMYLKLWYMYLISMMNVHPTGNAAHSTKVTGHVQLTTVSCCHKQPKSVPQLPL